MLEKRYGILSLVERGDSGGNESSGRDSHGSRLNTNGGLSCTTPRVVFPSDSQFLFRAGEGGAHKGACQDPMHRLEAASRFHFPPRRSFPYPPFKHSPLRMNSPRPPLYHCVATYHSIHKRWSTSIALSPDGELLASASADGTLVLMDLVRHAPVLCIDFETPLYATCVLWVNPRRLCVGRCDGAVQIIAVDSSKVRLHITLRAIGYTNTMTISPGISLSDSSPSDCC